MKKISPVDIILDHLDTFKDFRTKKSDIFELFFFLAVPAVIALAPILFGHLLTEKGIELLMTAASIFAGLFLNLLMLVFSLTSRPSSNAHFTAVKKVLLEELNANISFSVLTSLTLICSCLIYIFLKEIIHYYLFSFICYYLITSLIFTVLMVLKRTHALFRDEVTQV